MTAPVFILLKHSTTILLVLLCVATLIRESNARPPWMLPGSDIFTDAAQCDTDEELLDLCQRCAKLTKSSQAYPSCCSSHDLQARKWCADYVYFGRGDYDFYTM